MDSTKPWYASTTIWASVLQMAVGVGVSTGLFDATAGAAITTEGPGLIIGIVTTALGIWSLYGRIRATKTIGGA